MWNKIKSFFKNLFHYAAAPLHKEARPSTLPDPDGLKRSDCEEYPRGGYICPGCKQPRKVRIKHVGVCGYCVRRMMKENSKNIEKIKAYPKGAK